MEKLCWGPSKLTSCQILFVVAYFVSLLNCRSSKTSAQLENALFSESAVSHCCFINVPGANIIPNLYLLQREWAKIAISSRVSGAQHQDLSVNMSRPFVPLAGQSLQLMNYKLSISETATVTGTTLPLWTIFSKTQICTWGYIYVPWIVCIFYVGVRYCFQSALRVLTLYGWSRTPCAFQPLVTLHWTILVA